VSSPSGLCKNDRSIAPPGRCCPAIAGLSAGEGPSGLRTCDASSQLSWVGIAVLDAYDSRDRERGLSSGMGDTMDAVE
jgi:hypothetical protein